MRTLQFDEQQGALVLVDQTRLPHETVLIPCRTVDDVAHAIKSMQVRGAPAIGVAAAYGIALGAAAHSATEASEFVDDLERMASVLRQTRPTAVNLQWALDRMLVRARAVAEDEGVAASQKALKALADEMAEEDIAANRRMGAF